MNRSTRESTFFLSLDQQKIICTYMCVYVYVCNEENV